MTCITLESNFRKVGWSNTNQIGVPQYGNPFIPGRDDGLVPVWCVNSRNYFVNIDLHNGLQTENEYDLARSILLGIPQ